MVFCKEHVISEPNHLHYKFSTGNLSQVGQYFLPAKKFKCPISTTSVLVSDSNEALVFQSAR